MAANTGAALVPLDVYAVTLDPPTDLRLSRLWGIPIIGFYVRLFLLIPHALVMFVLGIGMYIVVLLGWIPILLTGSVTSFQRRWTEETIHRGARVGAYTFLFPGGYPPLGIGEPGPLDVHFTIPNGPINRLWGIPILGFFVRFILAVPHIMVLLLLGTFCALGFLVLWIPILITGRFPGWAVTLYTGTLRYSARLQAWLYMLPVRYPPFWLSN